MVQLGQLPEGNSVQRMFAATAIHAPDFATNLLGLGGTFQVGGGAQLTSLTTFVLRPRVRVTAPSSNVANRRKGCWKVSSCKSSYPQWGVYLVACNRHCPSLFDRVSDSQLCMSPSFKVWIQYIIS